MAKQQQDLAQLVALVRRELVKHDQTAGTYDAAEYAAFRERQREADTELLRALRADGLAEFKRRAAHDHVVNMGGFPAVSTAGWTGALHNWVRGAEKRIAAAAGELRS